MATSIRVLIVEDSEEDTELLVNELRRGGYDPVFERVDNESDMTIALEGSDWDVIISDFNMPQFTGIRALFLVQKYGFDIPFIVMSVSI
ncbi:MAG: response regulator [Nitrospirae bacterium]|nr:response regulator [Nitrospirota bacterium]